MNPIDYPEQIQKYFAVVFFQDQDISRFREESIDFQDQLERFEVLVHSASRHGSDQPRFICLCIVKPFGIQRTDLETKKHGISGKACFTRGDSHVGGVMSLTPFVMAINPYPNLFALLFFSPYMVGEMRTVLSQGG